MRDFYIAAPFFNDDQLAAVHAVESILGLLEYSYFSPRTEGGVLNFMGEEERKRSLASVFISNVTGMADCRAMLAIVDDKDTGTTWEHGFFYAWSLRRKGTASQMDTGVVPRAPIITLSLKGKPANVMLSQSASLHCRSFNQLQTFLRQLQADTIDRATHVDETFESIASAYRDIFEVQETSE